MVTVIQQLLQVACRHSKNLSLCEGFCILNKILKYFQNSLRNSVANMHLVLNLRILFKNYIFQRHVINQINRPAEYKQNTKKYHIFNSNHCLGNWKKVLPYNYYEFSVGHVLMWLLLFPLQTAMKALCM